jgi:hypothetical protein
VVQGIQQAGQAKLFACFNHRPHPNAPASFGFYGSGRIISL